MADGDGFEPRLEELRERREAPEERDRRLAEAVDVLRREVGQHLAAQETARGASLEDLREHIEAVRELANRCVESLDLVCDAVLHTRDLLNAKEAETVLVSTEGMRARTTLLLEELARQQEALLAELVGKHGQLDAALARAAVVPEVDGERD